MVLKKLLILGGGISGLTAAYQCAASARKKGISLQITVLEASARLGGAIHTEKRDGFLIEHGPDSFATDKPAAFELCRELGIAHELIGIHPEFRSIYLRHHQSLFPIPKDFHLMAPARIQTLLGMNFLSPLGKMRMAAELFVPPRKSSADESLGDFMERRFGREMLHRLGQPLLGSIFGCDIRNLSLSATFPKFKDMETKSGSVIRALQKMKQSPKAPSPQSKPGMSPLGMFVTLRSGMSRLVDALVESTPAEWVTSAKVSRIHEGNPWQVYLQDGRVYEADYLCLAMPAFQAASFFKDTAEPLEGLLSAQPRKSMMVTHAAFPQAELGSLPRGSGFVGSADSRQKIQGASFPSFKFEGRAPQGFALLRIFTGYQWNEMFEKMSDEAAARIISEEFCRFFKIKVNPTFLSVSRHEGTMPFYPVGHLEWLEKLEALRKKYRTLFLAGNSYRGASIPDCVKSAADAADEMINRLVSDSDQGAREPLAYSGGRRASISDY